MSVWALGAVLGEGVEQAGSIACIAFALVLWPRLQLDRPARRFAFAALALALWQTVSPALALCQGVAHRWPKSGRYGQILDTLAPAALGALTTVAVPWAALLLVLAIGWTLSTALGAYQHFVRWPFAQPWFLKTPVARVQEAFSVGGPPRYGSGGLLFHRLRFAHGAVALLGLSLTRIFSSRTTRLRAAAAILTAFLLADIYFSFARAALLAAVFLLALSFLLLGRGWQRLGVLAGAALLVLAALSPAWRLRMVKAEQNILEERHLSMQVGLRLVRAHPFLGVGFGNHQEAAWATQAETGVTPLLSIDSHDLWLTSWVETGLIGLLLTLAYHLLLGRALWQRFRAGSWAGAAGLISFAGFHLLSLVHYLQHHTGVYLTFSLVWGLALSPPAPGTSSAESPARGDW